MRTSNDQENREQREFDIVIFGATGFVGRLVASYFDERPLLNLRWALAGRDRKRLEEVSADLQHMPPVLTADCDNEDSLRKMALRTRVILTTVGPYAKLGSKLVKVCAENGTHYCDLSGEIPWIHEMIEKWDSVARRSGARIVHSCGFDSLPSDIGTMMLQKRAQALFGAPCKKVRLALVSSKGGFSGGTVNSMIEVMKAAKKDPDVRSLLEEPCALNPGDRKWDTCKDLESAEHDSDYGWVAPFAMAPFNTRIVRRSAALMPDLYGDGFDYQEFVQMGTGMTNRLKATGVSAFNSAAKTLLSGTVSRTLIRPFLPDAGEGPSQSLQEAGYFHLDLTGSGGEHNGTPFKLRMVIKGNRDPGYAGTARMIGAAAYCLAKDAVNLQFDGGSLTPAACFTEELAAILARDGVTFDLAESTPALRDRPRPRPRAEGVFQTPS